MVVLFLIFWVLSIKLNILWHSLLVCRVTAEKSADSLMGVPLLVMCCFSLAAFNILSFSFLFSFFFFWLCAQYEEVTGPQQWQGQILNPLYHRGTPAIISLALIFVFLITVCLGVVLFGLTYLEPLVLPGPVYLFPSFSCYIFTCVHFSFLSLSPSGTPIMWMLVCLMLSQRSLKLSSFFKMIFSFVLFSLSDFHYSVFAEPFLCTSNLLLILPSIFFISVIVFLSCLLLLYIF